MASSESLPRLEQAVLLAKTRNSLDLGKFLIEHQRMTGYSFERMGQDALIVEGVLAEAFGIDVVDVRGVVQGLFNVSAS